MDPSHAELFRYLEKAIHLTPREEIRTCRRVMRNDPEVGRLWIEFIRQVRRGVPN